MKRHDLHELGRLAAEHNQRALQEIDVVAVVRKRLLRVAARSALQSQRRGQHLRWLIAAAAAGALVVVAGLIWVARPLRTPRRGDTPPVLAVTVVDGHGGARRLGPRASVAATGQAAVLRFSESSEIALRSRTVVRLERSFPRGARVRLATGQIRATIRPDPQSQWELCAGPYELRVLGTVFDVAWDEPSGRFSLAVSRGRVLVRGPHLATQVVVAGQAVRASAWPLGATVAAVRSAAETLDGSARSAASHAAVQQPRAKRARRTAPPFQRVTATTAPVASGATGESARRASPSTISGERAPAPVSGKVAPSNRRFARFIHTPSTAAESTAAVDLLSSAASAHAPSTAAVATQAPNDGRSTALVQAPSTISRRPTVPVWPVRAAELQAIASALAARRDQQALQLAAALGWPALLRHAPQALLVDLGEAARLFRDPAARPVLLAIRQRFAASAASATVAYALGQIAFDQLSDPRQAARWFAEYLHEQPAGELAREAAGRLIEAHQRAGQLEDCRRAARFYLERFPDGPQRRLAERVLASAPRAGEPPRATHQP